jgi:hypothetical protein
MFLCSEGNLACRPACAIIKPSAVYTLVTGAECLWCLRSLSSLSPPCNGPLCSQPARTFAHSRRREAYGVRGACSRFPAASPLPQRQQAGRTPIRGMVDLWMVDLCLTIRTQPGILVTNGFRSRINRSFSPAMSDVFQRSACKMVAANLSRLGDDTSEGVSFF